MLPLGSAPNPIPGRGKLALGCCCTHMKWMKWVRGVYSKVFPNQIILFPLFFLFLPFLCNKLLVSPPACYSKLCCWCSCTQWMSEASKNTVRWLLRRWYNYSLSTGKAKIFGINFRIEPWQSLWRSLRNNQLCTEKLAQHLCSSFCINKSPWERICSAVYLSCVFGEGEGTNVF